MKIMDVKEKPDLLFNNPQKQKVYVFLKNNPGKDFETFQVLSGDNTVAKQHFNEVERAILAREEQEKARVTRTETHALFLNGASRISTQSETEDGSLKKFEKKKMNERAKLYIIEHPECAYDDLVRSLGFHDLTRAHFFSMKTQLRKKGSIPERSRTQRAVPGERRHTLIRPDAMTNSPLGMKTIEILESIDASDFSDEMREHYKSHILPLLQRLVPQGKTLQMVFLSDPPTIELRRVVVR